MQSKAQTFLTTSNQNAIRSTLTISIWLNAKFYVNQIEQLKKHGA